MMSFYTLPKGVKKKFDFFGARLLWGVGQGIKKYHLVNWATVCSPIEFGGLGVKDLGCMNIALLCKWIWKLETSDGLWQKVLYNKYIRNKTMSGVAIKTGDSWFWRGLLKVRDLFYSFCTRVVRNGKRTRFWEDHWIGDEPFAVKYKNLYDICECRGITVHEALLERWSNLKFRRTLTDNVLQMWESLIAECAVVVLSDENDTVKWKLDPKGFSVRSMYRALKWRSFGFPFKFLWKVKVPAKVKVFLWLVVKRSILTKDVLHHRGWKGDWLCQFCSENETISHLFFSCPLARYIWNVACCAFGFKNRPTSIKKLFGSWLRKFKKKDKHVALVGIAAVLWGLWKTQNNACF
jgi:hypothetical protein